MSRFLKILFYDSNFFDITKNLKSNYSMDLHQSTHPIHYELGRYYSEVAMATFKDNLLVNRIIALLVGGLIVFAIMSLTVVQTGKKANAELAIALDTSRYEAGRLLSDAQAQSESKDYDASKESLEELFLYQPGSTEAEEGKLLLTSIETAEEDATAKWEIAKSQVKEDWSLAMAADLRAESDKERADMEADLEDTIDQAWNKAKSEVRDTWEETDMKTSATS